MFRGILEELQNIDINSADSALISHILNAINSAILVVDHEDRLLIFNSRAEQLFGASMLKKNEKVLRELFMPEDREILLHNVLAITRSQGEFEGEVMLRREDGTAFIALMATSSWPWQQGQAIVITLHDITRLKGVERLLKESERMAFLGGMLDDISHQIRNPVLAIGGFSRRLAKTPQERPEYLNAITEEAARLENLLDSLTEFIRLPPQKPAHVPVERLLSELQPLIDKASEEYGIEIQNSGASGTFTEPVFVDIEAIGRAVWEIMKNSAEEAKTSDSDISITLDITESHLPMMSCQLRIRDTGPGIRPHFLPRIFNPFFTTKTGHTGMGLTLARRIVQEAAGSLRVESVFEKGTTALVHLPRDRRREIRRKKILL